MANNNVKHRSRNGRHLTAQNFVMILAFALHTVTTTEATPPPPYAQQVPSSSSSANFFMLPSDEAARSISLRTTSGAIATCKFEYITAVPASLRSQTKQQQSRQNIRGVSNGDVQSFLGRLSGVCIRRQFDYWKYEVCFEGAVTQSRGMGLSNDLGHFDKVDETQQVYDNGTPCDALPERSGRRSRIEFLCDQDLRIRSVVEESTCAYKIVVGAPIVCGHPGFRSVEEVESENSDGGLEGSQHHEPWNVNIRESEGGQVICSAHSTLAVSEVS
jgi:hypothetical protein